MAQETAVIGQPLDRVDGRLKVTGGARYSGEMPAANVAYAVMVMSTIPGGTISRMDTTDAQAASGVLKILTPFNAPKLPAPNSASQNERVVSALQDTKVYYSNQPIGVVIADTLERATHAAALVRVQYQTEKPLTELEKGKIYAPKNANREPADSSRGDLKVGQRQSKAKVEAIYTTPVENHNPMEPHATLAQWDGDKLTVYDATQGVFSTRTALAHKFGIPQENVRVVSHFLGGGFGCKGSMWSHTVLAAMAAREVGRPVKLILERDQMFGPVGYRPQTKQSLRFDADADGQLTAMRHDMLAQTSLFDEFVEPAAITTRMLYACPNQETTHRLSRLNYGTPTYMRAPGEASGTFALEAAMDELASELQIDPIALRLKNYTETDPQANKPFSSKSLRECYRVGAEKFNWAERTPTPRSMRAADGRLRGLGMATATYPTNRSPASALARLMPDGSALVQAGSQDIGTGTYTVMTQTAADNLGLPVTRVRFELGDTRLPQTPVSGGSQTAASVGSAVKQACMAARSQAIQKAIADSGSPLHGLTEADVEVKDGKLVSKADPTRGETYSALMSRLSLPNIEAKVDSKPGEEREKYSMHSFGAVFAEVFVDPDLGEIRLSRLVGAYGVGNILNAKTAQSQLKGGIIYGVGMALMEQTVADARYGRIVNANLAEYHVPVCADIPDIDVIFVPEDDPYVNPLGIKGIGEIGITGVVAAIANAVYHATGTRVRSLPLTLDKVL